MRFRSLARLFLPAAFASLIALTHVATAAPMSESPLVQVSGTSPFATCTADAPESQSGVFYPDSEVEVWIDVNPTDGDGDLIVGDNLVGTWQQDRWSDGGARGLVSAASFDGGQTWTTPQPIPGFSKCSGGTYNRATDPWVSFGPDGDLYASTMAFNKTGGDAILVNESHDGGVTWGNASTLIVDGGNDKESVTADPYDPNYVYATWMRGTSSWFTRSTDGGSTWEPARQIHHPSSNKATRAIGHQIVVLPNGTLVNAFALWGSNSKQTSLATMRSTDKGATWSLATKVLGVTTLGVKDPDMNGQGIRSASKLFDVAVGPQSGNLYLTWQDGRFDATRLKHESIAFSMSTNGGTSWSAPVKVNKTPTTVSSLNQQAFVPAVHVSSDGTVGVSYYDFRNNGADGATGQLETDYFTVHCHSSCTSSANWTETRVSASSFDMRIAPDADNRGYFVGDYEGMASEGASLLNLFSQTHGNDPGSVFFGRLTP